MENEQISVYLCVEFHLCIFLYMSYMEKYSDKEENYKKCSSRLWQRCRNFTTLFTG